MRFITVGTYIVYTVGILNIRLPVLAVCNRKPKSKPTTNYNPDHNPNCNPNPIHNRKTYLLLQSRQVLMENMKTANHSTLLQPAMERIPYQYSCCFMQYHSVFSTEQAKWLSSGHIIWLFSSVTVATRVAKCTSMPNRLPVMQWTCLPIDSKGYVGIL